MIAQHLKQTVRGRSKVPIYSRSSRLQIYCKNKTKAKQNKKQKQNKKM